MIHISLLPVKEYKIFIHSLLSFLSAFFIVKVLLLFVRYSTINFFNGSYELNHFEVICTNHPHSSFWTQTTVVSIYGISVVVSFCLYIFSKFLQKRIKLESLHKLLFCWIQIILLFQSFGIIVKSILIQQDFYYALLWLYLPPVAIYVIGIIFLVVYFKLQYSIFFEFVKISPSQRLIKTLENKRLFFIKHCILPVLCGYAILFLIHEFEMYIYEIVEFSVCILILSSVLIRKKNKAIKIHKNYTILTFNYFLLCITIICLGGYLFLSKIL
ncbi:MAG: hypothetical protein BWY22_01231 [Bacteroidetes bacterium ADurb.Bin217]|nr:MAG: hypothetical protein BWY22_01231 [Bacteroidetes bacterium ADurb.Bin217]